MKQTQANQAVRGSGNSTSGVRRIEIDFLCLDLNTCGRCIDTGKNLDAAMEVVRPVLEATGVEAGVRRTLVESEDQARALGFVSSPTIRIDGVDMAPGFRESRCEDCEACAGGLPVNCRVWTYQGEEHTQAPVGLIVEAIVKAAFAHRSETTAGGLSTPAGDVPENIQRFFSGRSEKKRSTAEGCCPPADQTACCEPSEKEACCGPSTESSCGCR